MTIDSEGILHESVQGRCRNYLPDKTRPTEVKAHNIEGLTICECLNYTEPATGANPFWGCGSRLYCEKYSPKPGINQANLSFNFMTREEIQGTIKGLEALDGLQAL